jgi:hypothetical protein
MHEFEELEDLDAVSQGDVFEWVDAERPWRTYGVVVTADCDLAREKHGGFISYVPAMLSNDFIWARWRIERFGGELQQHLDKSARRVSGRLASGGGAANVSADAIRSWLERSGADSVLDDMGVTAPGDRATLANVLKPAELLVTLMSKEAPDLKLLRSAYAVVKPASATNPQLIVADIQKSWNSLPGDLFHIPGVPGANDAERDSLFLHLRHIRQVPAGALSARPDALRSGKATCKRVARISAPFRYAMTQALGRVFTDIGLPESYETRCKGAAELFLQEPDPS